MPWPDRGHRPAGGHRRPTGRSHRAHGAGGSMMPMAGVDPISLLLVLAAMAVIPFAAMVVTSYAKIVVVLGLLRNAIGVQQVPPNMVLNGIALLVSCYIMAPIFMDASNAMKLGRPDES